MPHEFKKATATKASINSDRLPGRQRPKFVYAHHPLSWEFHDGAWLPRLRRLPLVPGVNGCRQGPHGHEPAISRLRTDGWTVIDESGPIMVTGPDGSIVEDRGYLCEYEGTRGPTYADAWSNPVVIGAGRTAVVDWDSQYDRAGFLAWRRSLVESGRIPAPSPAVLSQLIRRQERRGNRRLGESHDGNPHIQAHVVAELGKAEAMREAMPGRSPRTAAAPPPPATTRRPKGSKVTHG